MLEYRKRSPTTPAKKRFYARRSIAKIRKKVIEGYGSKCVCCGESSKVFLELDHVNDDGHIDRRAGLSGVDIWRKAIRAGFPPAYQLLCRNCNGAKRYGVCPHNAVSTEELLARVGTC